MMCDLVEERRLIIVHPLENSAHQCLADEAAFIDDSVMRAITLQHLAFALIEQNGNPMFAGRFSHRGKNQK